MRSVHTLAVLASLSSLALCAAAQAATISSLGEDNATGANWRTASTAKTAPFDPNGDNVYGSSGYFLLTHPAASDSGTGSTILQSLPSYSSTVSPPAAPLNQTWGGQGVGQINDPTAVSQPTNTNQCSWYYMAGSNIVGNQYDLFSFTLTADATFVLGVIHGPAGGYTTPLPQFRVRQTSGGSADSGLQSIIATTATNNIDYSFFTISGVAGDQFNVSGTPGYNGASTASIAVEGLTFETMVPEPTSLCALGLVGAGAMAFQRRRASAQR